MAVPARLQQLCELGERPGLQRGDVVGRCMRRLWAAGLGCPAQWGWIRPCSAAPCHVLAQGPCRAPAVLFAPSLPTASLGLLAGLFSAEPWPGQCVLERAWARSLQPPGPGLRPQHCCCASSAHGLSLLQPRHCHPQPCARPREHSGPTATAGPGGQRGRATAAALAAPSAAAAGHSCCASTDLPPALHTDIAAAAAEKGTKGASLQETWLGDP